MIAFTRQALDIAPASKLLYSSDGILCARDVLG